jgi:general secretion pathway protein G
VGISVLDSLEDAKHDVAYTEVRKIAEAVELYKLKMGKYPATGEGLQALSNPGGNARPFLKDLRPDPWGNAYVYVQPGTHNTRGCDIFSYGADGVQGGSDDVGNWQDAAENKQEHPE